MRVVIASTSTRDRLRLATLLGGLGHTIIEVTEPAGLYSAFLGPQNDVLILHELTDEWVAPLQDLHGPHLYLIVALTELTGEAVTKAWNAGADDVMKKLASPEEVAGRVNALRRIRRWIGTMGEDFAEDGVLKPGSLRAWTDLPKILHTELTAMFGRGLQCHKVALLPRLAAAAEVPLNLAGDGVEITIGIGMEATSTGPLSEILFGECVSSAIMADATRELSNTAGGAFKRLALEEDKTFSLGLPVDSVSTRPPTTAIVWRLEIEGGVTLFAWTYSQNDQPRRVHASALREGMVLSRSVHNGSGTLLVAAGSVLTQRTVQRLVEMVGPSALVEVARAA